MTIFIYVKRLCSKKGILGITCSTFLRSLFYIVVFHKSLRLTNGSRRKLASRRITNLISTNVESLQQHLKSFALSYILISFGWDFRQACGLLATPSGGQVETVMRIRDHAHFFVKNICSTI
ncbi:hypothetical protein BDA96_10G114500 [Sorghum bicolor]|uniref:Uncharacterized protein n=2 Tax=Sorghum bicolor TaxID=4558 RepID=A0A194YI53_SORBI|nr:hypothetical protein BDA96_10G114500 [Sorghum bicolor]KXG19649.1 hypothetical protein SORBI_3010G093800 [Sorghum bicolor]